MHSFGSKVWLNSWITRYGLIGWRGSVAFADQAARQRRSTGRNLGRDRVIGAAGWPDDVATCLEELVEHQPSIAQDGMRDGIVLVQIGRVVGDLHDRHVRRKLHLGRVAGQARADGQDQVCATEKFRRGRARHLARATQRKRVRFGECALAEQGRRHRAGSAAPPAPTSWSDACAYRTPWPASTTGRRAAHSACAAASTSAGSPAETVRGIDGHVGRVARWPSCTATSVGTLDDDGPETAEPQRRERAPQCVDGARGRGDDFDALRDWPKPVARGEQGRHALAVERVPERQEQDRDAVRKGGRDASVSVFGARAILHGEDAG